jgi:hypothetical protein
MRPTEAVWETFARHLLRYRAPELTRLGDHGSGWLAVMTGIPDVELNVTGLFPGADASVAEELCDRIDDVGEHSLVFVSSAADRSVETVLARRGFGPTATPEPLMWRPGADVPEPSLPDSRFSVRRVLDEPDLAGLTSVLETGITMAPDVSRRQFALDRLRGDGLGTWLAWDGDQPVSTVTLTWDDDAAGVFEMITAVAHRRRGGGQAVLAAALGEVLQPSMAGTVLYATPLGRPLYERLGFVAVDEATTWTRGASAEDLARVGQIGAAAS